MNPISSDNVDPSSPVRPRLGILQAGRSPEALLADHPDYNRMFVDLLGSEHFEFLHWPVLDGEFPDSIEDADAWLITGSRFGAYEDHDWIAPLEDLIRQIRTKGSPMVGICFGHQVIAQALGGKVEKFSGGWSVGRVDYQLDESVFGPLADENTDDVSLLAFHQDQVTGLPAGARNVGSSAFCEHAALVYDDCILTIQPHPEFTIPFIEGLLETRGEILPEDIQARARESLRETEERPVERGGIARVLRDFLSRNIR